QLEGQLCRRIGAVASLFPILHRREFEAEAQRKLGLREAKPFAHALDVALRWLDCMRRNPKRGEFGDQPAGSIRMEFDRYGFGFGQTIERLVRLAQRQTTLLEQPHELDRLLDVVKDQDQRDGETGSRWGPDLCVSPS